MNKASLLSVQGPLLSGAEFLLPFEDVIATIAFKGGSPATFPKEEYELLDGNVTILTPLYEGLVVEFFYNFPELKVLASEQADNLLLYLMKEPVVDLNLGRIFFSDANANYDNIPFGAVVFGRHDKRSANIVSMTEFEPDLNQSLTKTQLSKIHAVGATSDDGEDVYNAMNVLSPLSQFIREEYLERVFLDEDLYGPQSLYSPYTISAFDWSRLTWWNQRTFRQPPGGPNLGHSMTIGGRTRTFSTYGDRLIRQGSRRISLSQSPESRESQPRFANLRAGINAAMPSPLSVDIREVDGIGDGEIGKIVPAGYYLESENAVNVSRNGVSLSTKLLYPFDEIQYGSGDLSYINGSLISLSYLISKLTWYIVPATIEVGGNVISTDILNPDQLSQYLPAKGIPPTLLSYRSRYKVRVPFIRTSATDSKQRVIFYLQSKIYKESDASNPDSGKSFHVRGIRFLSGQSLNAYTQDASSFFTKKTWMSGGRSLDYFVSKAYEPIDYIRLYQVNGLFK